MENVILIVSDCLRFDRIFNYDRELTPNLSKLIEDSLYFTNAYSVGPNTPNSYQGIFGGVYPSECEQLGKIPDYVKMVPEIFEENGYNTYGLVQGNAWLSKFFGFDRGFDSFSSYLELSSMVDARNLSKRKEKAINKLERKLPTPIWNVLNLVFDFKDQIRLEKKTRKAIHKGFFPDINWDKR